MLNRASPRLAMLCLVIGAGSIWLMGCRLGAEGTAMEAKAPGHPLPGSHTNTIHVESNKLVAVTQTVRPKANASPSKVTTGVSLIRSNRQQNQDEAANPKRPSSQPVAPARLSHANPSRFTWVAMGLLGFSSLCGLLLLVTAAPKRLGKPQPLVGLAK
jgi:hypothetical protein